MLSFTRRAFVIAGAGASLSACASIGGFGTVVPSGATTPVELTQASILAAVNDARRANGGHQPMTYNGMLEVAARSQANLMASKDQLAHNLGVTLRERVTAAGYVGAVGENIAGGQQTLQQALEGWLNSPGHRATLLSDKFTEFGLAVARVGGGRKSRYGIYWCFIAGGSFQAWLNTPDTGATHKGDGATSPADGSHDTLTIGGGVSG